MKNASCHEFSLANEGYGPDILHLVEDKTLCALRIPAGDVLCLKQAAPLWWKTEPEHALKCCCEVLEGSPNTLLVEKLPETPPNKKMQFGSVTLKVDLGQFLDQAPWKAISALMQTLPGITIQKT